MAAVAWLLRDKSFQAGSFDAVDERIWTESSQWQPTLVKCKASLTEEARLVVECWNSQDS